MKVSRWAWVALLAAAMGVLLWKDSLGQAPAAPPPSAPRADANGPVVVVDVEEVVENYSRARDARNEMLSRRDKVDQEIRKRKDAIAAKDAMLKSGQLTEGTPAYNTQVNEHARLVFDLDAYQKYEFGLLMIEQHRSLRGLYEEVSDAVAKVAKDRHYKVVLLTSHKMPRTSSTDELREMIRDRKVIYSDPAEDITEMVLKYLNDSARTATTRP